MNRAETDLAQLLAQACERVRGIAPDFEVRLAGADAPLLVDGDERLLDQVFTNLLTNAVKYSGDSRAIDVSLATQGGRVEVAIRDYGIGIPEDELPQLFTRYFRASTARGIAGTGIGLDLARNLVEMHGGEVAVASRIGEGSTFTVRLDAKPVRVAAA
jgi:signal transduction histidine kinase